MNRRRLMLRKKKVDDSPAVLVDGVYNWSSGGYTSEVINGLLHIVNASQHITLPLSKTIKIKTGDNVVLSFVKQSGPSWLGAYFDVFFNGRSYTVINNQYVNVNPRYSNTFIATQDYSVSSIGIRKATGNPPNYSPDFVMAIQITVNGNRVL